MRHLWIVVVLVSVTACCDRVKQPSGDDTRAEHHQLTDTPAERVQRDNNIQQLQQIGQRDAKQDALTASQAGDIRLWAYHGRAGRIVPGIEAVADDWPVRLAPAMGDVIFNEAHRQARLQFLDYAERYNRTIMLLQAK